MGKFYKENLVFVKHIYTGDVFLVERKNLKGFFKVQEATNLRKPYSFELKKVILEWAVNDCEELPTSSMENLMHV